MSIFAALLEQAGHDPNTTAKHSTLGRIFLSEPVRESFEFERIAALPRRRWQDSQSQVDRLTARFARKPECRLLEMQAAALAEIEALRTCNVVASLGGGKTLVTALAPVLLGSKDPLFLNYARLIDKTVREFRALATDWEICHSYKFLSVEKLSLASHADYLERLRPDLIMIDEGHSLASPTGARFRRLRRYKEAHPEAVIVVLTATPGVDLDHYAHIQDLLLADGSPCPREPDVLREWCEALNVHVRGQRRPLGALTRFSSGGVDLNACREGVGRRIEETRGNVYSRSGESIDCSIYITDCRVDMSPITDELVESAWLDMVLPDGRCFEELYNKPLIIKQLGAGYAKVLDPTPPLEWREARSLWSAFVRSIVGNEQTYGLDTPAQVKAAVRRGEIDDGGLLDAWTAIQPSFVPVTKTEWFDLSVLQFAASWAASERGLVWVTQPTVGRKLAELSGLPFFHANGCDANHGSIEAFSGRTGAVLAVRPNMLGRNLQNRWSKNLYITPPPSSTELDQSIGRTARRGQKDPTVEVSFVLTVRENWEAVTAARTGAIAERALGKNESSRLLLCDWCVSDLSTVNTWKGPRWKR
jgi:hypothetical protein